MKGGFSGDLTISKIDVDLTKKDDVSLILKIRFDKSGGWLNKIGLFDWVDFDGVVKLDVQPILDPKNNRIYASDLALDLESSNKLADTLVELMQLTVVKDQLKQIFRYDFLPDMQRGKNEAYTALNTQIAQDVAIKGNIPVSYTHLTLPTILLV